MHDKKDYIANLGESVYRINSDAYEFGCYCAPDMYLNFDGFYAQEAFDYLPDSVKEKFSEENLDSWWNENLEEIDKSINEEWDVFFEDSVNQVIEGYPIWFEEIKE